MTVLALVACVLTLGAIPRQDASPSTPTLVRTIALPKVEGRIDHMACDPQGQRLYIAALGNGSLEVVDLDKGERIKSINGLKEPQGVAYVRASKAVAVACGGDGSVHLYDGQTLEEKARVVAGDDADNMRCDDKAGLIWVGVGDGALVSLDASTLAKKAEIGFKGHPESFQLDLATAKVFINVPGGVVGGGGSVLAADRGSGKVVATWILKDAGRNFPMALDSAGKRLYVACRRPAKLLALNTETGKIESQVECVGDADEVFVDSAGRLLAIGGDGAMDVFEARAGTLTRVASVKTESGARTGLFVPQRHAIYVAVPARSGHAAEVREYTLTPQPEPQQPATTDTPAQRRKP
jgi:DNA-binding beta-propeller fold protein YncE